jgi:DNA repair protein RecO
MGHEMHILEGFVLDSNDFGESGRILKILTKEYGVMSVVATGVRELKSKMRGSMDVLQLVTFEYVEGREINRLIGIHEKQKFENIFVGEKLLEKRRVVSNVVNFILRTVVGETRNEKLWESFLLGMNLLSEQKKDIHVFETLWIIMILVSLGYWESGKLDSFSTENFVELEDEGRRTKIILEINQAIKSTHL